MNFLLKPFHLICHNFFAELDIQVKLRTIKCENVVKVDAILSGCFWDLLQVALACVKMTFKPAF